MIYNREADGRIRAELLAIEREMFPPDRFGEVPLDCFPSQKIRSRGELVGDLAHDKRFLMVENAQLHKAFSAKAVEARKLRRQLNHRPAWTWIGWFGMLAFLFSTLALLWIERI